MHPLNWRHFFTLEDSKLIPWFETLTYPWEAIENIQSFFETLPKAEILATLPENVHLENRESIYIAKTAIIEPFSTIQGPCYIGEGCVVRQGAYLRSFVFLDDGAVVGHGSEIKNSFLMKNAKAPHFNYVGDSILGVGVNLGAGVVCANLRLDKKNVVARTAGLRMDTGLKKLGAMVGDGSQIGCNSVLNPGTFAAKGAHCLPCVNVGGFLEPESFVKNKL